MQLNLYQKTTELAARLGLGKVRVNLCGFRAL